MMKKNLSIELLRIFAMLGIISLHILNLGGVLSSDILVGLTLYTVRIYAIFAFSSVNVFAIITGYVYAEKESIKKENIVYYWSIALFYSIITVAITKILFPWTYKGATEYIFNLFPTFDGRLWYLSCYTLVFFLIPYLNEYLHMVNRRRLKGLALTLFILLSCVSFVKLLDFKVEFGLSALWLMFCYIIGYSLKEFEKEIKSIATNKLIIALTINVVIMLTSVSLISFVTRYIFGTERLSNIIWCYNSPFTTVTAVLLVILFLRCRVENVKIGNMITALSKCAFGVMILHGHRYFFVHYWENAFAFISEFNFIVAPLLILTFSIGIYLICSAFECARIKLYELIKVKLLFKSICDAIEAKITKLLINN